MISNDENSVARARVQTLIDKNTTRAGGDFHADVLDEDSFVMDLHKNFKVTHLSGNEVDKELDRLIKRSTVKLRGLFNSRELKQRKFMKGLFEQFKIEQI